MDLKPRTDPQFASAHAPIGADRAGQRLQEALVGLFPLLLPSRKACRKAIDRGIVLLNGKTATTAIRVQEGDEVSLVPLPAMPNDPGPGAPRTFKVIRPEGADHLTVWKPAGLATSGAGRLNLTRVLHHLARHGEDSMRRLLDPLHRDALPGPQPVHRLDRATAGWVCVALNLRTAEALGTAFANRHVEKRYLALVAGTAQPGSSRTPLDDKEAITHWSPLARGPLPVHGTATLLDVRIETGRTHQIRRHLAAAGHPLVGEDLYAPPGMTTAEAPRYSGHGLFLSAVALDIPAGPHGPALKARGLPPRKFSRIQWVAEALAHQEIEDS